MNNNALSVANKFIDLAEADGIPLTPLKLVKLTYLAHGYALVFIKDDKTIIDPRFDKVEAWKYGPVIPSVYHTFKYLRDGQVTSEHKAIFDCGNGKFETPVLSGELPNKIVTFVWNRYKNLDGNDLVTLLHKEGTPWALTYVEGENKPIPDVITKAFYSMVVNSLERELGSK